MSKIPFSPKEMEVVGTYLTTTVSMGEPPKKYNNPITVLENYQRVVFGGDDYLWMPTSNDIVNIESRCNLDHVARAEVRDLGPAQTLEEKGGPDMFGIEWVFVPLVGGSMVKPGSPLMEDANDWPKLVKFPDVEAMDWAGCAELNAPFKKETRVVGCCFQNGLFERLISFMDFEGAAMAIIDEDQQDAILALFDKLADMYIAMIQKYIDAIDVKEVLFHDDWGSQAAPFYSLNTCMKMVVPALKKIVDFCHSKGLIFQQHSCGKNELLVPAMIAAGVDIWCGQPMNDKEMLYEKYGKDIMLGIEAPAIAPDATDEEIEAAAKDFAEKHLKYPFVAVTRAAGPKFEEAFYRQSRIALCGQE